MTRREELIELTGQALNGMLSADDSVLTKILDRTVHRQVAETAVGIAEDALRRIDEIDKVNTRKYLYNMKARIKATNEVAEILKAEQYASSGEYRFFWLDIDKPEPFNRFRPDEVELIDDVQYGIDKKKFTQQDVNDLRLLSELAFDGACMSDEDEKLIKRVSALADKIEAMI